MIFAPSPRHGRNMRRHAWAAVLAGAVLVPPSAGAVGLGQAIGEPVMGEPLALEIPLLDPGSLGIDCFQLAPHPAGSDNQFFPRRARLELRRKDDGASLLALQGPEFSQPVVEFRVFVGCGIHVARDYVLLLAPGRELRYASVPASRPAAQEIAPRLSRPGPSLELMAGSRFPDRPAAREEFKRRIRAANPGALQGVADDAPIPLETDLRLPPEPVSEPVAPPRKPVAPLRKPAAPLAEKLTDRLSIGIGEGLAGATQAMGAADEVPRAGGGPSFADQEEMAARLIQTEAAYHEIKQQMLRMESRLVLLEQEHRRLREESRGQTDWSMLGGALAILGGGLLGALLMIFVQRRRGADALPVFDGGGIGARE